MWLTTGGAVCPGLQYGENILEALRHTAELCDSLQASRRSSTLYTSLCFPYISSLPFYIVLHHHICDIHPTSS